MQYGLNMGLIVRRYTWDIIDSNAYLMGCENKGLVIDTVDIPEFYEDVMQYSDITIILTHCHFDHICGLNKIRSDRKKKINIICTKKCSDKLGNEYRNMSSTANAFLYFYMHGEKQGNLIKPFVCKPANICFNERYQFDWCKHRIELLATYGHTDDGLIAVVDNHWLFSGDTLLPIPTTTRFPSGNAKRFWNEDIPLILSKISQTKQVFPGHGDPGTIEQMISINQDAL